MICSLCGDSTEHIGVKYREDGSLKEMFPACPSHYEVATAKPTGLNYRLTALTQIVKTAIIEAARKCLDDFKVEEEPVLRETHDFQSTVRGPQRVEAYTSYAQHMREKIAKALLQTGGNHAKAADLLGLSRYTVYRWSRRLQGEDNYDRKGYTRPTERTYRRRAGRSVENSPNHCVPLAASEETPSLQTGEILEVQPSASNGVLTEGSKDNTPLRPAAMELKLC